jgi:hypothetical protein
MNLFALTRDPARPILRIPLSRDVQTEVEALFRQQEADFGASRTEELEFDGNYKPDDEECLVIRAFDGAAAIHDAVEAPLAVPEIQADASDFATVTALVMGYRSVQGERIALLQAFDRRKIISSAGISLFHSGNVYRKVDGVGLTLDARLSAVLVEGDLKFFSFHVLRRMVEVSRHYVAATNADLQAFARIPAIHVADEDAFVAMADTAIRRKVTVIRESGILDGYAPDVIRGAALSFGIDIQVAAVGGRDVIVLPGTKADLKKVLKFLDEDYYQSTLQSINYVTNSKRPA